MDIMRCARQRHLILGLGRTGYSAVEHLRAQGASVTVADTRECPPYLSRLRRRHPKVEVITGALPVERYGEFDRIVVSPGLAPPGAHGLTETPAGRGRRVPVIGDIELFAECLRETRGAPVIGVTGSNGKSTVTTMVARLLEAAGRVALTGGNLGPPALDLLDEPRPDFYVIELSSFQLETTRNIELAAGAILNLSEDHLDRHPDMASYAAAKARILRAARVGVLNRDDANLASLRAKHPRAVTFGLNRPAAAGDYGVVETGDGRFLGRGGEADAPPVRLAAADKLGATGAHNLANALAALALVEGAGVAVTPGMAEALYAYRGLAHRCELVAEVAGVKWVNDSKATNVGATVAAIVGLGGDGDAGDGVPAGAGDSHSDSDTTAADGDRHGDGAPAAKNLILIAGGLGKGADFAPLRASVARYVDRVALFGQDAPKLAQALRGCARLARLAHLRQAVAAVAAVAKPGQTVLFSPACASFDQFRNYRARGEAFKQAVAELAALAQPPAQESPPSRTPAPAAAPAPAPAPSPAPSPAASPSPAPSPAAVPSPSPAPAASPSPAPAEGSAA